MRTLLVGAVGVFIAFALLFWAYSAALAVVRRRDAALVALPLGAVFVAFFLFVVVESACDECVTIPSIAVCQRRSGAINVQLESNRIGGHIVERQFAGCSFFWHENNRGSDRYGD